MVGPRTNRTIAGRWWGGLVLWAALCTAATAAEPPLATLAQWSLTEGSGRFVRDTLADRNGLVESEAPRWDAEGLRFRGDRKRDRVRIDADVPLAGRRFEIALELRPAARFEAGCLLASQPKGGARGGFRLCLSQTEQWIGFEVGTGAGVQRYTATLSRPLPTDRWSRVVVRKRGDALEFVLDAERLRAFEAPRLALRPSPYGFVIGGGLAREREGFVGVLRNVILRAPEPDTAGAKAQRLGYVTRGHWPLAEANGGIVRDIAGEHHGVLQDYAKRTPPRFEAGRVRFSGDPQAGGITIRNAGPIYGADFVIAFDAWFDDPANDWGTLVASKTGSSVRGGFLIDYLGQQGKLVAKFADGKRQIVSEARLPFLPPANEWVAIELRLIHGELSIELAGVSVGRFDYGDFELAPAREPLIIGSYYYPPSKGVRGSVRDLVLQMREHTIVEDEHALLAATAPKPQASTTPEACAPDERAERWVVGRNVVVPNWVPTRCLEKRHRDRPFDFVVDVPEGFELVGSGSSWVRDGRIDRYDIDRGQKVEHEGTRYRRHRVRLGYRLTAGYTAGYGPVFLRARAGHPAGTVAPKLRVRLANKPAGASAPAFTEIPLTARDFPLPGRPAHLHHSLAWMQLHSSMTWPDFFENYAALGFNVVPMLALYDETLAKRTRRKFMQRARREGFELLVLDSPYHRMIFQPEARVRDRHDVRQPFIDPSYRGVHYRAELERLASRAAEVEPDWYMMDIECFLDGAHACLIGAAPDCASYLQRTTASYAADPADAVTDLGTELVRNIRQALAAEMPRVPLPRMGLNTTEPDYVYHHLFDFEKLYGKAVDFAQPILYREHPRHMGRRIQAIRAAMPTGDIIPWMDPGTVVEYPSPQVYDRMLEALGSGARGLAWFAFDNFEGEDFFYLASAMQALVRVEAMIPGSRPLQEVEVRGGGVEASEIGWRGHRLVLLRDYGANTPRPIELAWPAGTRGDVWDLARGEPVGRLVDGRVRFDWAPGAEGAHTALYYVGPARFENGRFDFAAPPAHAAAD